MNRRGLFDTHALANQSSVLNTNNNIDDGELRSLSRNQDVRGSHQHQRDIGASRYVRRTSSLSSTQHSNASCSSTTTPTPLKRSLSDSCLLASPTQQQHQQASAQSGHDSTRRTARTPLGTLPYESDVPIIYVLNTLSESLRETNDPTYLRMIALHVLDSAFTALDDIVLDEDS